MNQKSLTKNSIYNIIYVVANILFPFVTSVYVSKILLPAGVGKVAAAQNIASYFVTLAALGLPSYGVREFAKIRDKIDKRNRLFTELLLINFISTTVTVILYLGLLNINSNLSAELPLYIVCGLSILFNYINIDWMYQGLEEYGYITSRSLLIKGVSLGALMFFVRTRQDYVVYALISALAAGGNYIFNVIYAKKYIRVDFSDINIKKHIRPIILIASVIFFANVYNKIDITMLKILANDEAVGYYSYAQKMLNIVLTLANAITATMLPRLSFCYENSREDFYRLLNKGFSVLCFLSFPLTVGIFLVAPEAVELLYGSSFSPTARTIQLMSPLILIKGFGDLYCYQLVYSTKSEKIILPAALAASIINILFNAVLIPRLLQNGAVIASITSELITNTIQFMYMKKKVKFNVNSKFLLMSFISTFAMSLGILMVQGIEMDKAGLLFCKIIIGGLIYLIVNLIMKNNLMLELLQKIRDKICA